MLYRKSTVDSLIKNAVKEKEYNFQVRAHDIFLRYLHVKEFFDRMRNNPKGVLSMSLTTMLPHNELYQISSLIAKIEKTETYRKRIIILKETHFEIYHYRSTSDYLDRLKGEVEALESAKKEYEEEIILLAKMF
jgi:hypothetical protein